MTAERCPCLSGNPFGECCGPLLAGEPAPTAERLMRSRYTAFTRLDAAYLLTTWHSSTRPQGIELESGRRWLRLDFLGTSAGGPLDTGGTVEFVAHSVLDGERTEQRELSRFVKEQRRWFYVDGAAR